MVAAGLNVLRYVIRTPDIQTFSGPQASGTLASAVIAPTQEEWIDAMRVALSADHND